ncbi:MAG: hypothetical protein GC137_09490 [Alphaproteobacteria bacterium]|nr:hypothetical protein [Alphaproteobacteria bacterium]
MCALVTFYTGGVKAADVPVTIEDDFSGYPLIGSTLIAPALSGLGAEVRNTCDPEFMHALNSKAWMEGQREISQNQNLIARPDSVLTLSCFNKHLDQLGSYANANFPSNPQASEGGLGNFFNDLIQSADELLADSDPFFYGVAVPSGLFTGGFSIGGNGFLMYAVLEVLVLDQLVNGVSASMPIYDALSVGGAACALLGKQQYIDDNFPPLALGGRAVATPAVPGPAYVALPSDFFNANDVFRGGGYGNCSFMNDMWNRSKCYNFATESFTFEQASPQPGQQHHDGFYTLTEYKDRSLGATTHALDVRTRTQVCPIPSTDNLPSFPNLTEIACYIFAHGFPSSMTIGDFINFLTLFVFNDPLPTWEHAMFGDGANPFVSGAYPPPNPTPGTPNGGVDQYNLFMNLVDPANCGAILPMQTGLIVRNSQGIYYYDAVCPAPGCVYEAPPSSPGDPPILGSCN